MVNSRASGTYTKLDSHISTGTEATYTFTPGSPLTGEKYSKIVIIINGGVTAALIMQMKINAKAGTLNHMHGWSSSTSALAAIDATSAAQLQLLSATALAGANYGFDIKIELTMQTESQQDVIIKSTGNSVLNSISEYMNGFVSETDSDIDSIEIKTSTSTWITGTKIDTYGLIR